MKLLSSCAKQSHDVRVSFDERGYFEECHTCNCRGGMVAPSSPLMKEIYDEMVKHYLNEEVRHE